MMDGEHEDGSAWAESLQAAILFLVDPPGTAGIAVSALPGPVRDRWLEFVRAHLGDPAGMRKLPAGTSEDRLLGGIDLASTLQAGRLVTERGLLAEADGGILVIPMAERLEPAQAAILGAVLDTGEVVRERSGAAERTPSRFGIIALDESMAGDEALPAAIQDRCAFIVDLRSVSVREAMDTGLEESALGISAIEAARARLPGVLADPAIVETLCGVSMSLGIASLRAGISALRAARAAAALAGRDAVSADDAALAAKLVLAPRATCIPVTEPPEPEQADEPEPENPEQQQDPQEISDEDRETFDPDRDLADLVLAAAAAAIPQDLLSRLQTADLGRSRTGTSGRAGALRWSHRRGRPIGSRRGLPRTGTRLSVIETLRAAAPWQRLREREALAAGGGPPPPIQFRRDDFRVLRFKQRSETTTIFVVDASGSAALHRLAEAKGAVELLLADCYVRRDQVALLAFRGRQAELVLPPSRSLVRAKRCLAGLPGGGGTPLAAALDAAAALADGVRRKGQTPVVVMLTDGQANITRDGTADRGAAEAEALAAARRLRAERVAGLLVDISPRTRPQARRLAAEQGATFLSLPYADATTLSNAVRTNLSSLPTQRS